MINGREKEVVVMEDDVWCAIYQLLPLPMQPAREADNALRVRPPRLPPTGESRVWKVSVVSVGSGGRPVTSGLLTFQRLPATDRKWLQAQDDTVSVDAQVPPASVRAFVGMSFNMH
jgi:hypothetical protein